MKRSILPTAMLTGAGKWITVALTTSAAVVGLIVNAKVLGISAWLGTAGFSLAERAARRVLVAPARDTLEAIEDTLPLAATVTDDRGLTLSGARLVWKSMNPNVATVDSSGAVVARAPGSTIITVTVRDLTARSVVTVRQRVAAVAIPDTALRLPEGATRRVEAWALDARNQPIADRRLSWGSADTAIAVVDSFGTVSARAPGRTVLAAAADEFSDRVAVEVVLTPASLRVITGPGQRAAAGRRLAEPVLVEVLSRGGRPIEGVVVSFAPVDETTVDPPGATTDAQGRARATWTLARRPGRQRLLLNVEGLDSAAVVIAEADPIPANTRVEQVGADLRGSAGSALTAPVAIRVADTVGVALTDLPVSWIALDQGAVEPLGDRTDSLGGASARWTLGPKTGPQRLRVQVGNPRGMPPTTLTAVALAGAPAVMAVASGDKQEGTVGTALRRPVVARVTDQNGNPVEGASIAVAPSAGSAGDANVITDARGQATIHWTLGRQSGGQRLALTVGERGIAAGVTARAEPGAAANVEIQAPPTAGTAGRALSKTITALVTDAYGNAVPDVLTLFTASAGTVSAARVMTSDKGLAATRWTLGSQTGPQTLTAVVRGTAAKTTLTVQAAAATRR